MTVHAPIGIEDALTMLDSRIPLTAGERRMIVEGLYSLAYKEGVQAERRRIEGVITSLADYMIQPERTELPEYEDPTTTIRRKLENKHRG